MRILFTIFLTAALTLSAQEENSQVSEGLTSSQMQSLVLIEGNDGAGSGSICLFNGSFFVVTNTHVLVGQDEISVSTMDGQSIEIDKKMIWLAVDHDIAIIKIAERANYLFIADLKEHGISIGDAVTIPGNERGGGVVTKVTGKVVGIGPKLIEVDAKFVKGNSGSPIIHEATGKVIGVATFISKFEKLSWIDEAAEKPEARWFGFRIDRITDWEHVDWGRFQEDSRKILEVKEFTDAFQEFFRSRGERYNRHEAIKVFHDRYFVEVLKRRRRQQTYGTRYRTSIRRFAEEMVEVLYDDLNHTQNRFEYGYFEDQWAKQMETRNDIKYAFEGMIEDANSKR